MKFNPLQDAACLCWSQGLIERAAGVSVDRLSSTTRVRDAMGVADIDEIAHALGELIRRSPFGDFHLAPATEQIGRAVALVFQS